MTEPARDHYGVLYVATGAPYVKEAEVSARSLKQADPQCRIALVTDQAVEPSGLFDHVITAASASSAAAEKFAVKDRGAYYQKIALMQLTPFERTIFLDSDTYVTRSLSGLHDLLDRYDLLLTNGSNAEVDYEFERRDPPFSSIPKEFGEINTGMLAWRRNEATDAFFKDWSRNFEEHVRKHTTNDQPALKLTLYQSSLRYHTLSTAYNWVSWIPNFIPSGGGVVVLHGRNPWLQKWALQLYADAPTVVGRISFRHQLIYHGSRILYWLQRKGWIKPPRL